MLMTLEEKKTDSPLNKTLHLNDHGITEGHHHIISSLAVKPVIHLNLLWSFILIARYWVLFKITCSVIFPVQHSIN